MPADLGVSFGGGYVDSNLQVFITASVDELNQRVFPHTKVLEWRHPDDLGHYKVDWPAVGIVTVDEPEFTVLTLGEDGHLHVSTEGKFSDEWVDQSREGPPRRGKLREIRTIAGKAYVAGMGRQAYRRDAPGRWTRIDHGALLPLGSKEIAGFNSIDGFDHGNLYAVGFDGEVWRGDGAEWKKLESPSTRVLSRVRCAEAGTVYACGQSGELLEGRGDDFKVIAAGSTKENLLGVEWFGGKLYAATAKALYVLKKGKLAPVDMKLGRPFDCGFLHARDGVMWSIGRKDLAYNDGKKWHEVDVR